VLQATTLLSVLSWQGVFLAKNFLSTEEIHQFRHLGERLRASHPSLGLQNRGNLTEANFIDEREDSILPDYARVLEDRITNVTGIPLHPDETSLLFTRQLPFPNPPSSVGYLHHDKNGRRRRTVTCLIYLTTTEQDEDGGHTLFPAIPRTLVDPLSIVGNNDKVDGLTTDTDTDMLHSYQLPQGWRQPASVTRKVAARLSRGFQHGHLTLTDGSYGNERNLWDRSAFRLVQKECTLARKGKSNALSIRPKAGDAVFFWSSFADGRANPFLWHTACVAVSGGPREAIQKFKEPLVHNDVWEEEVETDGGGER
jgi:hypothetical protein